MIEMKYIYIILLILIQFTSCSQNKSNGCKLKFDLKHGEFLNNIYLSKDGRILISDKELFNLNNLSSYIYIVKSPYGIITVNISPSNKYAIVFINDPDHGAIDWFIVDMVKKSLILKNKEEENTTFQTDIIWSDLSNYQYDLSKEKWLIIPQGGEVETKYYIVNLIDKEINSIELDFSYLDYCKIQWFTNKALWHRVNLVSLLIDISPNPWGDMDYNCKNDGEVYQPIIASLNLENGTYRLKR